MLCNDMIEMNLGTIETMSLRNIYESIVFLIIIPVSYNSIII